MKMNRFTALLAVLVTGTSPTQVIAKPTHPGFNAPTDIAQIKAIEEDLNTQTDMNKIIHYYAPDATVMAFLPGPRGPYRFGYLRGKAPADGMLAARDVPRGPRQGPPRQLLPRRLHRFFVRRNGPPLVRTTVW